MNNSSEMIDLYDIYDIIYVPWFKNGWVLFLSGVVFLLLVFGLIKLIVKKNPQEEVVSFTEHAFRQLDYLKKQKDMPSGAFYTLLLVTMKTYLQERFGVMLLSVTDQELIQVMESANMPQAVVENMKYMIKDSVLIKFAHQETEQTQRDYVLSLAYTILDITCSIPEKTEGKSH